MTFFPNAYLRLLVLHVGGLGVDTCLRDPAFGVRNRPCATVVGLKLACLWGKPQKPFFPDVSEDQKMCSCRFAWQAWHFVTFDVFQQECVCATVVRVKLACLWGKPQKRVFLDVSKDVLMSFVVASVA